MSGVKVGTRLAHLEALRRRVDLEISLERLAVERGQRPVTVEPSSRSARAQTTETMASTCLAGPLPPAAVIRAWAMDNGYLLPHQRTGPVPADVVELYREQGMS